MTTRGEQQGINQSLFERRSVSLQVDVSQYEFKDLVDIPMLGLMLDNLYRAAHIPSAIIDMNGVVLTGAGWQRFCTEFHRKHTEAEKRCIDSDTHIRDEIQRGSPFVIYQCPHGLVDSCCPIIIDGVHMANVFTGQLLHRALDDADIERFRKQAALYGFDEDAFILSLKEVPVFTPEQHLSMLNYLSQFAMTVAKMGLTNLEAYNYALIAKDRETELRRYIDEAPIGIFIADSAAHYLEVNSAAEAMTGYSGPELIAKSIPDLIPEDSLMDAMAAFQEVVKFGKSKIDTPFVRKDGGKGWWTVDAVRLSDDRLIGFAIDITEKKLAEKEREKLEAELRQSQKMEAMGTLAGGIAHDFNNILGSVLGYSEMALDTITEDNPAYKCVQQVIRSGQRARELIRRILAFSRKSEITREPVKLADIINETLRLIRAVIPSTIEIRTDLVTEDTTISADPTQIEQLLMNLCSNANQAMEEKGGILHISLHLVSLDEVRINGRSDMHPGEYFEISVRDTGIGIDPKVLDRVFDPFFTTKSPDKGTGMGLAMAHGIVKEHGGLITVESVPNKGSCFKVCLPKSAPAPLHIKVAQREIETGSERILVVDDEEPIVRITKKQLEMLGYSVWDTASPEEALRVFQSDPEAFDMVMTDQTMPKMTGDRLAAEMLRIRPNLPIVLCTGYAPKIWQEKACLRGIRAVAIKPISRKELAAMVRFALDAPFVPSDSIEGESPPVFGSV
jgi:PAS domain S-box-containing protein